MGVSCRMMSGRVCGRAIDVRMAGACVAYSIFVLKRQSRGLFDGECRRVW